MNINGTRVTRVIITPDLFKKLVTGKHLSPIPHKKGEKVKFPMAYIQRFIIYKNLVAVKVYLQISSIRSS
jgi:hypothetical protein